MDDAVLKAMARWPNVPAVFGWLRLDARGAWWVKNAASQAFERIDHPGIVGFIGRNYARDERGRYYFQNGPQRVFVALEATPYVFRLADDLRALVAHTDAPAGDWRAVWRDETGRVGVAAALGAGLVLDRDLARFVDALRDARGAPFDPEAPSAQVRFERGPPVPWIELAARDLERRFGFVATPA